MKIYGFFTLSAFVSLSLGIFACGTEDPPTTDRGNPGAAYATGVCDNSTLSVTQCQGSQVLVCDGTQWVLQQDCNALGRVCALLDTGHHSCVGDIGPGACDATTQGDTGCDGTQVMICNASQWTTVQDCALQGQSCGALTGGGHGCQSGNPPLGECTADLQGQSACEGTIVKICSNLSWASAQDCQNLGQVCGLASDGTYGCIDDTPPVGECTASQQGQTSCEGSVLQICSNTDWITAQDCQSSGQACGLVADGVYGCIDDTPPVGECTTSQQGQTSCDGAFLKVCSDTNWLTAQDCQSSGKVCGLIADGVYGCIDDDPPVGECSASQQGQTSCDGSVLKICSNTDWITAQDCQSSGKVCGLVAEGVYGCIDDTPPVGECSASQQGQTSCEGSVLKICSNTDWITAQDCQSSGKVCGLVADGVYGCIDDTPPVGDCSASQEGVTTCDGSTLKMCVSTNWMTVQDCQLSDQVCRLLETGAYGCVQDTPPVGSCASSQTGQTRCHGVEVQVCNGTQWLSSQNCASLGRTCQEVSAGIFGCAGGGGVFGDPCATSSDCAINYDCVPSADQSICLQICNPNSIGIECPPAQMCAPVSQNSGYCFDLPKHGELCWYGDQCHNPNETCVPILESSNPGDYYGTCTPECSPAAVGTTSGCSGNPGEYCLPNPSFWNTDSPGGNACTVETEAQDCAVNDGFECVVYSEQELVCSATMSLCGQLVPFWDGTVDSEGGITDEFLCGGGNNLCGVVGAVGQAADVYCEQVFDIEYLGICVGVCEPYAEGDPDLSCGMGYSCVVPAQDEALYYQGQGGEVPLPCTEATVASDCDPVHQICIDIGYGLECARALKLCLP